MENSSNCNPPQEELCPLCNTSGPDKNVPRINGMSICQGCYVKVQAEIAEQEIKPNSIPLGLIGGLIGAAIGAAVWAAIASNQSLESKRR